MVNDLKAVEIVRCFEEFPIQTLLPIEMDASFAGCSHSAGNVILSRIARFSQLNLKLVVCTQHLDLQSNESKIAGEILF